jgi:2-polyprenyl-3-methyl-5-hydroxy-6-metoxy-1,4-benzoquinol methylase
MNKYSIELEFNDKTTVEFWDELYNRQDFYGDVYRQRMGTVLSWLDGLRLPLSSRILDIGCGAGRFAREAAKKGYKVLGTDYSHEMLVKANSICNSEGDLNVTFLQGSIEALPLQISTFDVIVCLGVVGHLKSTDKALKELAKVLKPNGILFISFLNKARLVDRLDIPLLILTRLKRVMSGIAGFWKKGSDTNYDPPYRTYFIPEFKKSLELAGFKVLDSKTIPWKLLTFCGKEVYPKMMATKITRFFEHFSNIPIFGSFGGMCVMHVKRTPLREKESGHETL